MLRIEDYLSGKVVFITGATGFLGQPLVEKILFGAPEVRRVHVLIRPRKLFGGRVLGAQERLENELYGSSVFDRLRGVHGSSFEEFLRQKLRAVAGDISQDNLGLCSADAETLRENVDVVINSAAVVSFDAPIDEALELNVMAARRITEFVATCRKAVFVHVSTAYVSGTERKIAPETMYHSAFENSSGERFPAAAFADIAADIEKIRAIVQGVKEEAGSPEIERQLMKELVKLSRTGKRQRRQRRRKRLEGLRKRWTQERLVERGMQWARERGWNDTYTYTKALGEQMVVAYRADAPTVILRPSIIESSLSEPCPGWLDGLRMADPLIVAIGKGRLKSLPLNPDVLIDLVPVDVVVNALLASIPEIATRGGLDIYQVATGSKNPITLGELYKLIYAYFKTKPMLDKTGQPIPARRIRFPKPAAFRIQHQLKRVPLETAEKTLKRFPLFDSTEKVRRRLAATKVAHQKLYYYGEIYEPYLNLNCRFQVDKTTELFEKLDEEAQRRFNFDVTRVNWRHYIQNVHIPGVKKFILKIEGVGTMELEDQQDTLPAMSIPELIGHAADTRGDQVALQMKTPDGWERFTYGEVRAEAERIAASLRRLGCVKGDRVVLFSENQPRWGIAYLGASFAGLVVVPIDAQSWHEEVWSIVEFTEAKALLASEKSFARFTPEELEKNERAETPLLLLNVDQFCRPFDKAGFPRSTRPTESAQEPGPIEVVPDDPASIIFTTGTAVDPRGAVHTHRSFLTNLFGVHRQLPVHPGDNLISVLPLFHALEFTCGFLMAAFGGATVTYAHTLKPRGILELMRETGTTCMLGVPTFYALLRDDMERRILRASKSAFKSNLMATGKELSRTVERNFGRNIGRKLFARVHQEFGGRIRLFVSGGSALGEELYEDFRALGMPIYEGYGLTETAPVLTVNPINLSRPRSAGRPLAGVEVRLDHPDQDGIGEIVVRSPSLMTGYYKNDEATRKVMQDGWLRTGDMGWVDVDGYIYITGRCKNVIVTGAGKNVYPEDLEAIYRRLPAIREIAVLGIKSGLTEDVHAVVRPTAESVDEHGIEGVRRAIHKQAQQLARELPTYHRLQFVHAWPRGLPHHSDGMIDRQAVRRRLEQQLEHKQAVERKTASEALSGWQEEIVAEVARLAGAPDGEITPEMHLYDDLGLDSLKAIELLLFVEDRLGVTIPDEKASRVGRVSELLKTAEQAKKQGEQPAPAGEAVQPPSVLPLQERSLGDRLLMNLSFGGLSLIFRAFFGFRASAAGTVPKGSSYIIAANHCSHLDTGAVITAVRSALGKQEARRLHVLGARDYFFDSKLKGWLVSRLLNVVPIERKESSLSSLRLVKSILARGEPVLIFPEGTRSRSGLLQDFKPGLGLMAWETRAPIVPTYIRGTYDALPAGRFFPRRREVKVVLGDPLNMRHYAGNGDRMQRDELYRRIASDVRERIESLAGEQDAESPGGLA